ncbi:MAG: S-layer homology domain-containing protein, partial [Pseudoflavonifractor sp.]
MQLGRRITALIVTAALLTGLWTAAAGSGTAPFRDMDLIVHQEAVLLMAELGVLSGKEDGSFAPGEGIDRASMCRMIYGIMMGDLDPAAFSGVAAPLADIQGTWAEDYIKYCYSVGIVSSTGGNRFRPTGPVSVAAAAKMLLVCLGFDAAHRGYENSDLWSENIMRDAAALGLMDRVPQQPFEPITRENAAQMIYNVLFIQTRTPIYRLVTGGKRITDYRVRSTTLGLENFGLVKCVMTVGDATTNPSAPKISFVKTQPKAAAIQGGGVILDALNPHGGFPMGPELAASNVALYAKADYKLDENGDIAQLTFRQLYSTRLFPAELPRLGSSADGTPIHVSAVAAGEQLRDLTHNVPGNTAFIAPLDDTPTYY